MAEQKRNEPPAPAATAEQRNLETGEPNEGEGSRTAARGYDEKVTRAARDARHVKEAAEKAKKALDEPEGKELAEAEQKGKRAEHR